MPKDSLAKQRCEACHAGAPQLSEAELAQALQLLSDWRVERVDDVPQLTKTYSFKNFKRAAAFAMQVAMLAEENDHHPAINLEWGKVEVRWWTHKIKGLHRNDAICAAKTDELVV